MKVLVANRGEIACRVAKSADSSVGIYVGDDRAHLNAFKESVEVSSYLAAAEIIEAAKATQCEAIHPGYGFLSENPDFAQAVVDAGLIWVGPRPDSIRAMGLKDNAKALMDAAGVPVVPGYHGDRQDVDFLRAQASRIGYPVLIKARAGGGGKGMRRVDASEDFADALASAQREANAAFGDDAVLIEKYIETPRHIEVQVVGDAHGKILHLFERDCSMQRRHQKVIEEAPAPAISEEFRQAICAAAVSAARAVDYVNAGTVEFIVPGDLSAFYFMEMNTRLQVEHPVTEGVTGLDLVALQLSVAANEPLPFDQADVGLSGHSIEARLYAEDPAKGFLPAVGTIAKLTSPTDDCIRFETALNAGSIVSGSYDPMIAKVIATASSRDPAREKLINALAELQITGITTNAGFLARLLASDDFAAARLDTALIDRAFDKLALPPPPSDAMLQTAAQALAGRAPAFARYRHWGEEVDIVTVCLGDARFEVQLAGSQSDQARSEITLFDGAEGYHFTALDRLDREVKVAPGNRVDSPMPGRIISMEVAVGDTVTTGLPLLVLEAMKMEQTLRAPRDGVVASVNCAPGDQVSDGDILVELEP